MAVDRGVVLSGPGAVALEEIRVEPPGPGEVLVRVEATGVCHSDLHVIEEDGWGHAFPVLLGHEGAGTVEAVGGESTGSRPETGSCSGGRPPAGNVPRACVVSRAAAPDRPRHPGGSSVPTAAS